MGKGEKSFQWFKFGTFIGRFLSDGAASMAVNVCVIIILSTGNTQISILLLCFLYLFVELTITRNEYILFKPSMAVKELRKILLRPCPVYEITISNLSECPPQPYCIFPHLTCGHRYGKISQ